MIREELLMLQYYIKKMTVLQKLSLHKVSTTKGIATKGIGYKRFRQQMVSETKGVDFYSSLVW